MSNAPNASDPVTFESTSSEPAAKPARPAGLDAELELIRGALTRLQTTAGEDRSTLGRLRGALGEMAGLVAQAKTALAPDTAGGSTPRQPFDTGALLDEFEHLIDAMIEISGGAPAPRAAVAVVEAPVTAEVPHAETAAAPPVETAEFSEVPTVSGVVSGLGSEAAADLSSDFAPASDAADMFPPLGSATPGGPTVEMLKALVEALNASVPETRPEPEAEVQPEPVAQAEPDTMAELEAPPEPEPEAPPVITVTRRAPAYREIIAAADPPRHDVGDADEAGTAISIAQTVQSFKWQPPEAAPPPVALATPEPQTITDEPQPATDEATVPDTVDATHALETVQDTPAAPPADAMPPDDTVALHEFDLLASVEQIGARPMPPLEIGTAVIFPPRIEEPPEAQALYEPTLEELIAAELSAPRAEPHVAETTPSTASADIDPETLLFGPEPEPDPAAFLLDPPPDPAALLETQEHAAPMTVLPRPEFVAPQPPHAETPEPPAPEPAAAAPQDAAPTSPPADAPYDPLAPLKAMSEAEKIALFS